MQTGRQWSKIFKAPKGKRKKRNYQPTNLYPKITPFKTKGKGRGLRERLVKGYKLSAAR